MAPGEFCFRGGLIDLFPMGSAVPYRLDLDDDVVETIRTFDVDTQRTLYAVKEVRLLPAREFPLDDAGRTKFRGRWRELFEGDPSKRRLYKDVSNGVPAAGIEYYLPLFFDALATLFDYLPGRVHPRAARRRPRRHPGVLARRPVALQDAGRRSGPAAAAAGAAVRSRGRVLHPRQGLPADRHPRSAGGRTRPAHHRLPAAAARRGPARAGSARGAQGLPRRLRAARAAQRRIARPARNDARRIFAEYGLSPSPCGDFEEFSMRTAEQLFDRRLTARQRLQRARRRLGGRHRGGALRGHGAAQKPRRQGADLGRGHAARPLRAQGRRPGGARAARHRPLRRPDQPGSRRRHHRIPAARVRRRRQALRAGVAARGDFALLRRAARGGAAAQAGQRPVGQGKEPRRPAGARHRRRAARPVRQARRAPGPRLPRPAARPGSLRRRLRLRGNAGPGRGDRGGGGRT